MQKLHLVFWHKYRALVDNHNLSQAQVKKESQTQRASRVKKQSVAAAEMATTANFATGREALSSPLSKVAQAQAGTSTLEGASLGAAV